MKHPRYINYALAINALRASGAAHSCLEWIDRYGMGCDICGRIVG
jgi:hypothetical protein